MRISSLLYPWNDVSSIHMERMSFFDGGGRDDGRDGRSTASDGGLACHLESAVRRMYSRLVSHISIN